jgi:nucleotide-binding universal stress UspA family protein
MNKKIKNILVPIDFTEHSLNALEVAIDIAKRNNAKIVLVHIVDIHTSLIDGLDNSFEENWSISAWQERRLTMLDKLKVDIEQKHQIRIDIIVKKGLVTNSIVGIAQDMKMDLIIMGTHGTGERTFFLGINAYRIVQQTSCSVLTIPNGKEYGSFTKILFPEKALEDVLEKYNFLIKILNQENILIEMPGLIKNEKGVNINLLNETILFLGNNLMEKHACSLDELRKAINNINQIMENVNIKLITIEGKQNTINPNKWMDFSSVIDNSAIPILSITYY